MRPSLAIVMGLLGTWCATVSAQELGTLFHTPKERELLERLRRGEKIEATAILRPDPTVTGFVKRSDGKSTVFLDKQPFTVDDADNNKLIEPGIVERFEPQPAPPPPPLSQGETNVGRNGGREATGEGTATKPGPAVSPRRANGSKEE